MGGTHWLNEDEQRTWRTFMVAARLLITRLERDLQHQAGILPAYYELLVLLSEAPQRTMRMSELASRAVSQPSRVSHAVKRLEASGLLRREHSTTDRRGWLAVLTDQGQAVLEAAAPIHVRSVRAHLIDLLSPAQLRQLGDISQTLLDHLAPSDSPNEPS